MIGPKLLKDYKEEEVTLIMANMGKAMGKSANYRGQILEHFAILETNLELLIAEYFTNCDPIKSQQLIFSLFGQETFNFNNKRRLAIFVLKNGLPEFHYSSKKLDGRLQKVSSFRNIIAHRKVDFRPHTLLNFNGEDVILVSTTTAENIPHASFKTINQALISKESKDIADLSQLIAQAGDKIREKYKKS